MSSAFSIALSALQANSEAINTTGNNLANMNTVGFKGSTVDFETLISQNLGQGSGFQVGMGVGTPVNQQLFSQGPIQNSNSPTAVAIQGNGFFVVNNSGGQQLFTRDGDFSIDKNGTLVTQTGEQVQGWVADNTGNINTSLATTNIELPAGQVLPASVTTKFSMTANLDSSTAPGPGAAWTQPIQIVDSLGNTHNLTVTFTNVSNQPVGPGMTATYPANTWTYDVTMPDADLKGGTSSGAPVSLLQGASAPITFNSNGTMVTTASGVPSYTLDAEQAYTAPAAGETEKLTFTTSSGATVTANLTNAVGVGDTLANAITTINTALAGTGITAAVNTAGTGIKFTSTNVFSVSDIQTGAGTAAPAVFPAANTTAASYNPLGTNVATPASVTLKLPTGASLADSALFGASATNPTITWNLVDSSGNPTLTQYAQASGVQTKTIDGSQPAQLTGFSILNGGQIVANFSNGDQRTEGQLALASIENPESMQSVGDNNFAASGQTAAPAIGTPQTGGRGQILGSSIEGSNVDMATEFTKLITYQSGYQASSRVISTANQMTQDLMNLIH